MSLLEEMKRDLEKQLKESENDLSELNRMAQEIFAGLKQRYDADVNNFTTLFVNLSTKEAMRCDELREKLGLNNVAHALPQPYSEDAPVPFKAKRNKGDRNDAII